MFWSLQPHLCSLFLSVARLYQDATHVFWILQDNIRNFKFLYLFTLHFIQCRDMWWTSTYLISNLDWEHWLKQAMVQGEKKAFIEILIWKVDNNNFPPFNSLNTQTISSQKLIIALYKSLLGIVLLQCSWSKYRDILKVINRRTDHIIRSTGYARL